jgi:DNA-binding IclR family transcriptional regulator
VVRHPADRRYHLGPGLIAPGRVAAERFPSGAPIRQAMERLARAVGYPVFAFRREGDHARLVETVWDLRRPAPAMRIGDLLPIEPPLGSVFVAWDGPAAEERWLARTPARDALRARLDEVRRLGFVVELRPPLPLVQELARFVARGQNLRRAERIRASVTGIEGYLVERLAAEAPYEVATVSAPVPGPAGTVDLALNLLGFADATVGAELLDLGRRARAAADELGAALAAG